MTLKRNLVVVALLMSSAMPTWAQGVRKLDVSFDDGRVTIVAENVTLAEILGEWARKGGSRIVNAERLPGSPVMLTEFKNQPEAVVLRTLLREAPGYAVQMRTSVPTGSSSLQTVFILAVRTVTPSNSSAPPINQPQIQAPPQAAPRMIQGTPDDEIPPVRPIIGDQPPTTPGGTPPPSQPSNPNLRIGPGGVVTSTVPGVTIPGPAKPATNGRGGGGGSR